MNDSNQNTDLSHLISPHSISVYGESIGYSCVTEEAAATLSYDVSQRLYELLNRCRTEMNVYRQTNLSMTILNNVFQSYGVPPLHGNKFLIPFVSIPNSDMSVLHLSKVNVVDQGVSDKANVEFELVPLVKGIFVSPLTKMCGIMNLMKSVDNSSNDILPKLEPRSECEMNNFSSGSLPKFKANIKNESFSNVNEECNGLDEDLTNEFPKRSAVESINKLESDYYVVVAQVILNSSESLFKLVLDDVKTNPRLGNVCASLLNLISNSIKHFKCSGNLIDRLLRTIEALLDNKYIDPSSFYSVDDSVNVLCSIILEPKMANDCDDFPHRMHASYLLMRALNTWNISVEEKGKILVTIKKTLMNPEKMSLKLNYGILLMFYSLGCDNLDAHFWPLLSKYLNVLCSLDEIISGKRSISLTTDICHVKAAVILVSGMLYRNFWSDDPSIQQLHMEADVLLHSYFGECLFPIRNYALPKIPDVFSDSTKKLKQRGNKDVIVDVTKNYRNVRLFASRRKFTPHFSNFSIKPKSYRYAVNEVFEISLKTSRNSPIIFNFIGSNQISELRGKHLDVRYNTHYNGCLRNQRFLKYEKTTRCIKYCNNPKICSGDIYLFL